MARDLGVLACAAVLALALAGMPGARGQAQAQEGPGPAPDAEAPRGTGLPLPRFASLRASEVFMRAGPGTRYPVEWIYRRQGLPVEIVAEFDAWRKVRDWNGTVGWMHRAMLSGRRTAITTAEALMRRAPAEDAPAVARAAPGVITRILACAGAWCRLEARGMSGWAPRAAIWGTLPDETVD